MNTAQLSFLDNVVDPAVAAGAMKYLVSILPYPLEALLTPQAIRAYELLYSNYTLETDAVLTMLTQRLALKPSSTRLIVSFGLFGSLLASTENESDIDSILTPAAAMLLLEHVPEEVTPLYALFESYINTETQHSYAAIMIFVLEALNASKLKFSHVYHARALPIFVQMMRNIPDDEYVLLNDRFRQWLNTNIAVDQYSEFAVVAVSALQIFYRQMLEKSDWPN